MNGIKNKILSFMYGRYMIDELYYGLFALWAVLVVINTFFHSTILYILSTAVIVYGLFRFLSKNHQKRRRENEVFLKLWKPVKSWFILQRDKFRDHKTARYRKCPKCRAVIKLPNKKGKHTVCCPRCGERFGVHIVL